MSDKPSADTRRSFLRKSAWAAAGAGVVLQTARTPKVLGANDTVRLGFVGVGNRGSQLLNSFLKNEDMRVAALCDVYLPFRERDRGKVDASLLEALGGRIPRLGEKFDYDVPRFNDFRRMYETNGMDAVVIATPDHWHAVQTIMACEAGFDVYVEKPLSITVREGRAMVNAVKRTNRVVQVGLHRRSSNMYRKARELIRGGAVGKVSVARAYRVSNMYPHGIGRLPDIQPPEGLDWDLWIGPRPLTEYQDNIAPYKFRWWNKYSSQMANWGVHYCDAIRWMLGERAPASVSAHGGRFAVDDDRTVPDTMEAVFEFDTGRLLVFGQYEASGGDPIADGELEFRGTLGNFYTGSEGNGFKIVPTDGGQFQERGRMIQPMEQGNMDGDLTDQHTRNFLDCVKSRETPNCDVETGHRSTTFALVANIALATRSRLDWDPDNERFANNEEANNLLHYEYRKPWTLG